MTTGQRIREARKEKGLTQKELGKLLNVSQATVQQYESGSPKKETVQRIASVLGVPAGHLLKDIIEERIKARNDKLDAKIYKQCSDYMENNKLFYKLTNVWNAPQISVRLPLLLACEDESLSYSQLMEVCEFIYEIRIKNESKKGDGE